MPLTEVTVRATGVGLSWGETTDRSGCFRLGLLPAGEYEVLAEQIGFRPKRITDIVLRADDRPHIQIRLTEASGPAPTVEEERWIPRSGYHNSLVDRWLPHGAWIGLPLRDRSVAGLQVLSSRSAIPIGSGPDGPSGVLAVNGVELPFAGHPDLVQERDPLPVLPLSAFEAVELAVDPPGVEWASSGDVALSLLPGREGQGLVSAYGEWSELFLSGERASEFGSAGGGAVFATNPIPDSLRVLGGVDVALTGSPIRRVAGPDVLDPLDPAVAAGLADYSALQNSETERISAFTALDWRVGQEGLVRLFGGWGTQSEAFAVGAPRQPLGLARLESEDLISTGTVNLVVADNVTTELRIGGARSTRDYSAWQTEDRWLAFVADRGAVLGTAPDLPGMFERSSLRIEDTFQFALDRHLARAGLSFASSWYLHDRPIGAGAVFYAASLASPTGFAVGRSSTPVAEFSTWQLAGFVEDEWLAAPGVTITAGLRYEIERLPVDAVTLNQEWLDLTDLSNASADETITKISPRGSVQWDVGGRGRLVMDGRVGVYHERVSPGILARWITDSGQRRVVRTADISTWPSIPDPSTGVPTLTLLSAGFRPPRTVAAGLGLTLQVSSSTALHGSLRVRTTDFLPRYSDLNILPVVVNETQYGREIYGTLVKVGRFLAAEPGTNRRFDQFDQVTAITSDGAADLRSATIGVRHEGRRADFRAWYTYATGSSNAASVHSVLGDPIDPFAPAGASDWSDGTPDRLVPHSLGLAGGVTLPVPAQPRLSAVFTTRSGYAFTPGFPPGVDINGDGVSNNDPAFIDRDVPGADALLNEWECLRSQVGQFAEPNSCRTDPVQQLDVRLEVDLLRPGSRRVRLYLSGLNILDDQQGAVDPALYRLEPGTGLSASGGTVTVPLEVNPRFGQTVYRWNDGRRLRLGVRLDL